MHNFTASALAPRETASVNSSQSHADYIHLHLPMDYEGAIYHGMNREDRQEFERQVCRGWDSPF